MSGGKEEIDIKKFNIFCLFYFSIAVKCEVFFVLSDAVLQKKWKYLRDQLVSNYGPSFLKILMT